MAKVKCPSCGKGKIKIESIPEFETKLRGIPFVVKDAKIAKCDTCGEQLYNAKEVKRWEEILKMQLKTQGLLISPQEIRSLREAKDLSVADFASIFGVTRQTVYGWESDESNGIQLGPASLLLCLLVEEKSGGLSGICDFLVVSANNRGQQIKSYQRETIVTSDSSDNIRDDTKVYDSLIRKRPLGATAWTCAVSAP